MKNKITTLIEKQGFKDNDRTPKHDEIQMWVADNPHLILQKFKTVKPATLKNYSFDIKIEVPIEKGDRQYKVIVGAIDIKLTANLIHSIKTPNVKYPEILTAYKNSNKNSDTFWCSGWGSMHKSDLTNWKYNYCSDSLTLYVEIKSTIVSMGDLVRQINFYKSYIGNVPFIVVSPDNRFEKILEQQGILFVQYPK